jgi:ribosome biogenesis GTPase
VRTEQGDIVCRMRGRLRRGRAEGDRVAVGDRVHVSQNADGSGNIEEVLPRKRVLSRALSGVNYEYEQVILANPDQVLLVFALREPDPKLRMLDRFLVIAEREHIPAIIIANKLDLMPLQEAQALFAPYERLGYEVIYASALSGEGIATIRKRLKGKLSTLAGPSGVGKSSLLNAVHPGLELAVGKVSQGVGRGKGRHTTQVRQLFELPEGGWVADVPGMRTLALWDIQPEELDAYYREIAPLVASCQFSDCTHSHEPGCAVQVAVEKGEIHPQRYESYLRLRFGGSVEIEEDDDDE